MKSVRSQQSETSPRTIHSVVASDEGGKEKDPEPETEMHEKVIEEPDTIRKSSGEAKEIKNDQQSSDEEVEEQQRKKKRRSEASHSEYDSQALTTKNLQHMNIPEMGGQNQTHSPISSDLVSSISQPSQKPSEGSETSVAQTIEVYRHAIWNQHANGRRR